MLKTFLLALVLSPAALHATDWRLSNPVDLGEGLNPFWCQTNCILNSEVLFNTQNHGSGCQEVWSMHPDGTNKTNLSATKFVGATTKSHGTASYSPDGAWIILGMQANGSTFACSNTNEQSGVGIDNQIWVCKVSTFACTQLTAQPVDGQHGILGPKFTRDGTRVWYMQISAVNAPFITGHLWIANWNPATPSLSGATMMDPNGPNVYYEPGDTDDNLNPDCIFYYQQSPSDVADIRMWQFNNCTSSTPFPMGNYGIFVEWWRLTPRANIALAASREFMPQPLPLGFGQGTDLIQADARTGLNRIPLTCFNTPGGSDYDPVTNGTVHVGTPAWNATGTQLLLPIYKPNVSAFLHLWSFNYTASAVAP